MDRRSRPASADTRALYRVSCADECEYLCLCANHNLRNGRSWFQEAILVPEVSLRATYPHSYICDICRL